METFEKLGDFKKAVKATVRGAVKAGVFGNDGKYVFRVSKTDEDGVKTACVCCENGPFEICVGGEVVTRIFNKLTPEFFAPITTQFEKLAKVESITFVFA